MGGGGWGGGIASQVSLPHGMEGRGEMGSKVTWSDESRYLGQHVGGQVHVNRLPAQGARGPRMHSGRIQQWDDLDKGFAGDISCRLHTWSGKCFLGLQIPQRTIRGTC